jgi:ribonuclease HIII
MAKRGESAEEKPKKLSTYTIKLDDVQMDKLRALCVARQWEPFEVPYARFAFRGTDVNVTAYDKRKVVVIAGKGHETTQTIGNVVLPFDDRTVARELLEAMS